MRDLAATEIRRLHRKINAAEQRIAMMRLPGKVAKVDAGQRQLRLGIGTSADGRDILGPWTRWAEAGAGGLKIHAEPAIGEQMDLISQSGTVGAASIAMHATYDADNAAPSQSSDTAVIERGGRIELGPNGIRLIGNVDCDGGHLRNNGVNVGDDHIHTEVERGNQLSGPPQS